MEDNKKTSILLIYWTLRDYSDENHYLKQQDIIDHIKKKYGISLQRKAVSNSITLLEELDIDIDRHPKKGCRLLSRDFDESEVKYLVDAIFSSKNITGKQAKKLAASISASLSIYQRRKYEYLYKSVDLNRNSDSDFFYNIEIINEAIEKKKQISFQYASYDADGKERMRSGGYTYRVSPYFLVNNFGKYYLLCNYYKYSKITNFRVDLLRKVTILEENSVPMNSLSDYDPDFSINRYINDHIYIFGGKVSDCKIKINHERVITYVKDWFGKNALFSIVDGVTYANIRCDEKAFYYWCLQYGEDIEVLEPVNVVIDLSNTYKHMYERYKDILETHEVKPQLEENISNFMFHGLYKIDDEIESGSKNVIEGLKNYLFDVLTKNYKISSEGSDILISNERNAEEKYLISFNHYQDDDYEDNLFHSIKDIARLEEESKNGVTCFHVTLVRNAHYYSGEGESEVTDIFREKKEISPKNDITFVNHNGFVEKTKVQKYYKISWRGITTTKAERPLYKFFVLNIK